MITEQDLKEAILECEGERNPNASTCLKLAAFYTIRNEMFGKRSPDVPQYSFAPAPVPEPVPTQRTEFAEAFLSNDLNAAVSVIDELMSVLQATNPRLYSNVMRRLQG